MRSLVITHTMSRMSEEKSMLRVMAGRNRNRGMVGMKDNGNSIAIAIMIGMRKRIITKKLVIEQTITKVTTSKTMIRGLIHIIMTPSALGKKGLIKNIQKGRIILTSNIRVKSSKRNQLHVITKMYHIGQNRLTFNPRTTNTTNLTNDFKNNL